MNPGNIAFVREFAEADTAQFKVADIAALSTTAPASTHDTGRVLRLAVGLSDLRGCSHNYFVLNGKPS